MKRTIHLLFVGKGYDYLTWRGEDIGPEQLDLKSHYQILSLRNLREIEETFTDMV